MAAPQARPLTPLPPAVVPGSCTRGGAALFAARRHSLLDVLSLRSRDRGAPERQWGRSRWVDLRWPVSQGSVAHVGRIRDPAQRKWRALRASACRRAAYTFSRIRYARDLDHGTYTSVFALKSRSRGYVCCHEPVWFTALFGFFPGFFLTIHTITVSVYRTNLCPIVLGGA